MEKGLKEQVSVGERVFVFSLCRKREGMGPVPVDQWWMPVPPLYRHRGHSRERRGNYEAVVDCFWALCLQAESTGEDDVRESYLLARLLPFTRDQGSRQIFPDAHLASRKQAWIEARQDCVEELDSLLSGSRDGTLDRVDFRDRTADALGPAGLSEEEATEYGTFCAELLDSARALLAGDEAKALEQVRACWDGWMRSIGRRGGKHLQKKVLDVISYECRAALHRCYSAAWEELLVALDRKYRLSPESLSFLKFWHLEDVKEVVGVHHAQFHLFHGHVFALHPATGEFIRTDTGRELVGDWLQHPEDEQTFRRLLHGMWVATHHYAIRRRDIAEQRKKRPPTVAGTEIVDLEERQAARKSGRRGDGRHREDSAG